MTTFAAPAGTNLPAYTDAQTRAIIDAQADLYGLPRALAEATSIVESGLNPYAQGDKQGGVFSSFGLFQLHKGGELGNLPGSFDQQRLAAFDPVQNARVALRQIANVFKANPGGDPGQIAAAAQRPADQAGYAKKVDAVIAGGNVSSSSTSSSSSGATNVGLFGLHGLDPLAWPGQIVDSSVSGVWDQVQPFLLTALFAVGAIALFVIGAKQLVQPATDKVKTEATTAAAVMTKVA